MSGVCPDDVFCTAHPFVTSLSTGVHRRGSVMRKEMVCCLGGQDHSEVSYHQDITVSVISSQLLILLQANVQWWYVIINWNDL